MAQYVELDGQLLRLHKTRDVRFYDDQFPFEAFKQKCPDFEAKVVDDTEIHHCAFCEKPKTDEPLTCAACCGRHRAHTRNIGCSYGRCSCDDDDNDEAMASHVDGLGAVRQDVSPDFEDDAFSDLDATHDAGSNASTAASEAEEADT